VGETMLPYVVDRPLSLVRCPRGRAEPCFFQKHQTGKAPASLATIPVREGNQWYKYFAVKNLAGLLALVQLGVLEIHLWGAPASDLERPDRLVFDLDPGPGVVWAQIVEAATTLRGLLAEVDLKSFVKTTGGKGLHIVAPLKPQAVWAEAKQFCKSIAQQMAAAEPAVYTTNPSKAQRPGKIFLDYLRNDRGATSVAPFSTRARPGAPVSVPLAWRELSSDLRADHFNVRNVPERLATLKTDPWKGFFTIDQELPRSVRMGN
jgi:bifunctional non-homologous end joining protein LigD